MFTSTRLVVAGAMGALFGGFLLAAVWTGTEAARDSTGTSVPGEPALSEPLIQSMAGLKTRRVGPGIVRVVGDGTGRSLDKLQMLFISSDGTVWAGRDRRVFRLGSPGSSRPLSHTFDWYDFSVSEAGGLRVRHRKDGLLELRDGRWVELESDTEKPYPVHRDAYEWTQPFHAVDGSWWFGRGDPSVSEVLRYTPDEAWQRLALPDSQGTAAQFIESSDGTMWAVDLGGSGGTGQALYRFDGDRWERVVVPDDDTDFHARELRLGEDGTLVVRGYAFDGSSPTHVDVMKTDTGWLVEPVREPWEDLPLLGAADRTPLGADGTGWAIGEDGKYLVWFDGETETRVDVPFRRRSITPSIHHYAVAPDGSLWFTIQSDHPSGNSTVGEGLYVITPDAVAAPG